jgi:hypothetical protein
MTEAPSTIVRAFKARLYPTAEQAKLSGVVAGEPVDRQRRRRRFLRSATAVGAVTIETLSFGRGELGGVAFAHDRPKTLALERGEVGVEFTRDLAETLALARGELGEAFARDSPETLAFCRGELGVAFTHKALETLALARGKFGVEFAPDLRETLALARGELGVAFARDLPETLALARGELGEAVATSAFLVVGAGPKAVAFNRSAHAALADAALLAIKSRHTQRRAAYGDGCCRQTNRYVTHHDADTPLLYFRAPPAVC